MKLRKLNLAAFAFLLVAGNALAAGEASNVGNDTTIAAGGCQKTLRIRWQRLVTEGKTCPRCASTGEEVEKAVASLSRSLAPLGITVLLKKDEIPDAEFKKNPLQSNQIWLNGKKLEDWLGAKSGQSRCCDACGTADCKTVGMEGVVYETIPAELVIKAGLLAASELVQCAPKSNGSPCCPK